MRKRLLSICLFTLFALLPCITEATVTVFTDRIEWEEALSHADEIETEDFEDEPLIETTALPYLTAEGTLITNLQRASNIGIVNDIPEFDSAFLDIYGTSGTIRVTLKEPTKAFGFDYWAVEDWNLSVPGASQSLRRQGAPSFLGFIDNSGSSSFLSFDLKLAAPSFFSQQDLYIDNLSVEVSCGPCHDELLGLFHGVSTQLDEVQASLLAQGNQIKADLGDLKAEMADLKAEVQDLAIVLGTVAVKVACETPKTDVVRCPENVTGSTSAGDASTLCVSDNSYLLADSKDHKIEWVAQFRVPANQPICEATLRIEGNSARKRESYNVSVAVFNWSTSEWDVMSSKVPFEGTQEKEDKVTDVPIRGPNIANAGLVRIRVSLQRSGRFRISTDSLKLFLKYP